MSKAMPSPNAALTTTEVCAEYPMISRGTLLRLRRQGKIQGRRFGREFVFLRRSIEAYLAGDASSVWTPASARRAVVLPDVPSTI